MPSRGCSARRTAYDSTSSLVEDGARNWTCDFTAEYVRINASYRT